MDFNSDFGSEESITSNKSSDDDVQLLFKSELKQKK